MQGDLSTFIRFSEKLHRLGVLSSFDFLLNTVNGISCVFLNPEVDGKDIVTV